jgi:hypothetical protein
MQHDKDSVYVAVGEGMVTLKRYGRSRVVVAGVLGEDKDAEGVTQRIYLDRLVHKPYETKFIGWRVSGAVSTILTRAA